MPAHFNSNLETWIESNVSNNVVAVGWSQKYHDIMLKPVEFMSKKCLPQNAIKRYMIKNF